MQPVHSARTSVLALGVTFLCVVAPAAARFDAQNAKKVDGIKATKSTSSARRRRGKLVATDKQGLLPSNIVALVAEATHAQNADHAANSDQLGGQGASAYQLRVSGACSSGLAIGSVNEDGTVGCATTTPSGSAAGALAGTYPSPTLNVTGGPCANGKALTNVSSSAALTCATGVYTDASHNLAAGVNPFAALTTGHNNSVLGETALTSNTSGNQNVALGSGALHDNTTGQNNVALGDTALFLNTTGSNNIAIGSNPNPGFPNFTGSNNVLIGGATGFNFGAAESSNIEIENQGTGGDNHTIRIGTPGTGAGQQNQAFMAGISGTTIAGPDNPVLVNGSGQLGTATASSRRFKHDIHALGPRAKRLMRLRPVSFRYRRSYVDGGPNPRQFGLIAEQVAKVYPNLAVYGKGGRPSGVQYQELPALELAQLQHQHAQLRRQRSRNRAQGRRLHAQGTEIASLRRAVARLSRRR